jgi:hypothetical protein
VQFDEIHREFLRMESDLNPFDITVDGVPVWERVRLGIHRQVMYELGEWDDEEPDPSAGPRFYLRKLWLWSRNVAIRNPLLADQHDVLYWGHHRRKKQPDGFWWDIYTDPIHAEVDQNYLQVEAPHFNEHHTPAKTANLRYLDLIQISAGIARTAGLVDVAVDGRERRRLSAVEDRIAETFGVDVDLVGRINSYLTDRRALKPLYRRFLRRVDPDTVVLVVHSGKETFIETCHDLGVTVVELQQAILNEYEYAYSFPGERTKEAFPDYYLSWGRFWNEQVEFPIPDDHVIPVGYPYLERTRRRYEDVSTREQLLFVSQPNVGRSLSQMAAELAADPDVDFDVVYKLHPHEYDDWRAAYPELVDADSTVVDSDEPPLYELFAQSSAQVGVFSTAIYEGLSFDLDTYLVNLPGVEHLANLYRDGPAELVESSQELRRALARPERRAVDPARFFEPNAIENVARAFATIEQDLQ